MVNARWRLQYDIIAINGKSDEAVDLLFVGSQAFLTIAYCTLTSHVVRGFRLELPTRAWCLRDYVGNKTLFLSRGPPNARYVT
jgi:hypothetical protein